MKKFLVLILILMFFVISCSSSKKAENDADLLPDGDEINDEDTNDEDEEAAEPDEDETDSDDDVIEDMDPCDPNPCGEFANTDGTCGSKKDETFECGCVEGYFWGHLGCKKITYANICTGQTKCYYGDSYDTDAMQKCPREDSVIYGQDAQYAEKGFCLPKRFSTDETAKEMVTTDKNLGIEWTVEIPKLLYYWEDAAVYCSDLNYADYSDWRLPSARELTVSPTYKISSSAFFWSSQAVENYDSYAWQFDRTHNLTPVGKKAAGHVRCVRNKSGENIADEVSNLSKVNINGSEIVQDKTSGILWQSEISKEYRWTEAMFFCEHSTFAGFSDWRLPNINELTSLINYSDKNVSDFPIPGNIIEANSVFWSSTTNPLVTESPQAYAVDLKSGEQLNVEKYSNVIKARALCLRNEPCREGYWWNGTECVENPCADDPCKNIEHSDGTCRTDDFKTYFCGCDEGWFWNGKQCAVNPCEPNPCGDYENSTGECRVENSFSFICSCDEGYWWWGKKDGCVAEQPHQRRICTGQTKCYDMEKEIPCPAEGEDFFGQDSQYARLGYCVPQNFYVDDSVEDEPIVIDKNTGLEWQQKFSSESSSSYCSNITYGGYSDWRLPTLAELLTLLYYDDSPTIDLKYFPDTPPEIFWASGECNINFEKAEILATYASSGFTRCVRGENLEENRGDIDTVFYEDGYLYTNHTMNLIWTRVEPEYYYATNTWSERMKYCEDLDFAGFTDWRLPNIRELTSISLKRCWLYYGTSSTTMPWHPAEYFGDVSYKDETDHYYICIRENPCTEGQVWDHGKCVDNICVPNPCEGVENSYEGCGTDSSAEVGYVCGCNDGYLWDSDGLRCVFKTDFCDPNPCEGVENGTGECIQTGPYARECACIEGYKWDGWKDVCKKDD